jgi:putative ABC transport system permease protein
MTSPHERRHRGHGRRLDETRAEVREELAFGAEMRTRAGRDGATEVAPAIEDHLVDLAVARERSRRWRQMWSEVAYDALDALRRLRRAPAFTAGVVAIVALGLGATSAVLRVANVAFLRPLPFAEADRIVRVQEYTRASDGAVRWVDGSGASLEVMRSASAFSVAAALNPLFTAIVGGSEPQRIAVGAVTAGWWSVLGVRPAVGRSFTPVEEAAGDGAGVVMISDELWRTRYGGRTDVLGSTLSVDGGVRAIVGVMPPGYRFPYDEDAWWPTRVNTDQRGFFLAARLAPGVSFETANQQLDAVGPSLVRDHAIMRGNMPRARHFREILVGDDGRVVLVLAWAVALLLLIVASNVTMLFLTRLVSRERELAVRAALGCGRARQVRHLVIEAWIVFTLGGAFGLAVSALAERALLVLVPHVLVEQTSMRSLAVDARVLGVTVALVVVCGALVGLVAAWRAPRTDLTDALRATARAGGSVSGRRVLGGLVVAELGLAAVLVATAVTVASGLRQLEMRDVGFRTDNLLTWHLELGTPRLRSAAAHLALVDRVESRLGPLGGSTGIGMSTVNPLCCGDWGAQVAAEGQPVTALTANAVNWRLVTPNFFHALGVRVVAGRAFDRHDIPSSEPVAIVDERFAHRYWPGGDAVGHRIKRGATDSPYPWMRVVGVVSAVEDSGDYTETWYVPYLQNPSGSSTDDLYAWIQTSDVAVASAAVRAGMREIDPALPVLELQTMEEVKQTALAQRRHASGVAMSFGAAGVLLALCGVYALVAFVVARERRDMGVRMALGATGAGVVWVVVRRLLTLGTVGIVAGTAAAALIEPPILAALKAHPMSFWPPAAVIACVLLSAAGLAAWLPARRVLLIDPLRALSD